MYLDKTSLICEFQWHIFASFVRWTLAAYACTKVSWHQFFNQIFCVLDGLISFYFMLSFKLLPIAIISGFSLGIASIYSIEEDVFFDSKTFWGSKLLRGRSILIWILSTWSIIIWAQFRRNTSPLNKVFLTFC